MGYLNEAFNSYYYSSNEKQKNKIKEGFKEIVWGSLPYTKLKRFFKYKISYDNIKDEKDINILEKYKHIEYKILKSRYNINELQKEDLIKARINSNYGKYFDKEIYLKKEYYWALANYKNIYFKYLNGEIEDLEKEITKHNEVVDNLKKLSLQNKYDMEWDDYKGFINTCFDKIFENYRPLEVKIQEGKEFKNHVLDWDEDNYILGYVNKSLNGCLKDYKKKQNGFYDKFKWNHHLNKYIELEGVTQQYNVLQICIGKYYVNINELLKVTNQDMIKLTKKQKELIQQISSLFDKHNDKQLIFFNKYGIPYINELFVSKVINKPQRSLNMMILSIYNNINKDNEDNYCINCGKKITKKSNRQKYCDECWKEKEREIRVKINKKYYEKNKIKTV